MTTAATPGTPASSVNAERQAMGIQPLPESLDEALRIMEKSDFVADVLGRKCC